ncbi:hypothetical protein SESBI_07664 [Sesbania bispinosa]|nr:hypothetical protein SESBI_07664 [Sesbania bispinosa]
MQGLGSVAKHREQNAPFGDGVVGFGLELGPGFAEGAAKDGAVRSKGEKTVVRSAARLRRRTIKDGGGRKREGKGRARGERG